MFQIGPSFPQPSGVMLTKHSPFTEMLNQGIQRLKQSGMMDVLIKKHAVELPRPSDAPSAVVLGGKHMGVVFILYGIAVAGSLGILVIEAFYRYTTRSQLMV